ncbi:hypothetical protein [Frigoribacterium sp. Leaf172]|uniref:hypothetical protein n=1 Tax=Frigoribacterium sp. Leaf172 TaxID=1736285 RepID=UPI0006F7002E|nr:hypothetical protein [Frigoribacterium sp. Leaf172]KQR65987.1 hypothetical protein ASF89_02155 [Frigoribacterium sp. Leaf172]
MISKARRRVVTVVAVCLGLGVNVALAMTTDVHNVVRYLAALVVTVAVCWLGTRTKANVGGDE